MFTYLESLSRNSRGFSHFPKYDVYRRGFRNNISTAVRYYREHDFAVRGDHILIRLLASLPTRYWDDVELYYRDVHDLAYECAGRLKITCPIYAGGASNTSWFFGPGYVEFPLALHSATEIDVKEYASKWQTLESVKFRRHPRTDLGLVAPNQVGTDEYGIVIYEINIPVLALQYRMWREEQMGKPRGERENIAQFVAKYPVANSIPSMVDIAFMNRFMAKFREDDVANSQWRYPMNLPNNLKWIDAYIEDMINEVRGNSYTFAEMLRGLRCLTKDEIYDLYKLPATVSSRQCSWLTYMAQAPITLWLVEFDKQSPRNSNTAYLNEIRRDIRYAFNDNLFNSKLPAKMVREVMEEFKLIRSLAA